MIRHIVMFKIRDEFKEEIPQLVRNFYGMKGKIEGMFEKQEVSIGAAEKYLTEAVNGTICELLTAYYEACDEKIYADKRGRKKEKLSLVRHGDRRHIETVFGGVDYKRDYYRKADGSYCYPVDQIAGISSYMRMSEESAAKLVSAAVRMPLTRGSASSIRTAQR